MIDVLAAALVLCGGFFCLVAGIGVVRMTDVFTRMHAATKAGTLGLALIALAAALRAGDWRELVEPLVVLAFMLVSAPVGAHLIGRAAFRRRSPLDPRTVVEPAAERFRRGSGAPPDLP